ncbi:GerMN domain-containing protein [Treponema sp. OMZ 305]|uniref:GerMN domain-containing protein n=1 Tax=Treponema sp. OMZ 305 TaxID=1659192 RepID=UPI0020A5C1F9|nr:GerMN domain-containing protein [Treponema sp. OMZ 305]UTC58311.1 GerMN domain-containing protein [Treponema sp. OMZ 305]
MNFFTKPRLICRLLLSVIAGMLFLSYMTSSKQERTLLYFQQSDGGIGIEERYLPPLSESEFAVSLVNELLLGPADHRFLRFADPELRLRSCFVRDNALYIDFPAQVLTPDIKAPDFHTVYTLLRKNIAVNCKNIGAVYFYIDGVPAYVKNYHSSTDNKKS